MIEITHHQSPSLDRAEESDEFWTELAIMEFSRGVRKILDRKQITQKELAAELELSEPYVSKVLSKAENLTIKQMQKILGPLQAAVHVFVAERKNVVRCQEMPKSQDNRSASGGSHEWVSSELSGDLGAEDDFFLTGTTARA